MIAFRDNTPERKKHKSLEGIKDGLQELLDIIYNNPEHHSGSFHEESNISDVIDIVYKVLYEENNNSLHLIIDKKSNNSFNITIDKIK